MANPIRGWLFKNIANGITILGIILSIWLVSVAINSPNQLWVITTLIVLIGLTDLLDGKVARFLAIKSVFGGALDRLRDKTFICSTLFVLLYHYQNDTFESLASFNFTAALVISVIIIECLLLFVWLLALIKKWNVDAGKYGKIKMTLQFIIVLVWIVSITSKQYFNLSLINFSIYLLNFLLLAAIYFGIKSLEGYYRRYA